MFTGVPSQAVEESSAKPGLCSRLQTDLCSEMCRDLGRGDIMYGNIRTLG